MKSILNSFLKQFACLAFTCLAFAASAETAMFNGMPIEYSNATTNWVGGELVLSFASAGSLTLPVEATADLLVVGGGGSGYGSKNDKAYGDSGNGGQVTYKPGENLSAGTYEMSVGWGGSSVKNGNTSNVGTESYIQFGETKLYPSEGGKLAGTSVSGQAGSPKEGTPCDITGDTVVYGTGGAAVTSDNQGKGGEHPGDGGVGSIKNVSSGAGANGVVIVRIKVMEKPTFTFQGQTIEYFGAEIVSESADGVLLKYSSGVGSLDLPKMALADYLVVGGGGSGGKTKDNNKYGGSGYGGKVELGSYSAFQPGAYTITVGAGGQAVTAQKASGNAGSDSSITGPKTITADGGKGGAGGDGDFAKAGEPSGTTSSISGAEVVYGKGGDAATATTYGTAGADGTGNGGVGGNGEANKLSGKGGDGVVYLYIHSLKDYEEGYPVTVKTGHFVTITNETRWGEEWTLRTADATIAAPTAAGSDVSVLGKQPGETMVMVENATTVYAYKVTVTCDGDPVAHIGDVYYESLADAATAAKDGETVKLLGEVTLTDDLTISNNVTIAAEDGTVAIKRGNADANLILAEDVTFSNVTLDGAAGSYDAPMVEIARGGSMALADGSTLTQPKLTFQGKDVSFDGAEIVSANDSDGVVLKYTDAGELVLPDVAQVEYLVVGGGGSGGKGKDGNSFGASGNGGQVVEGTGDELMFPAGTYAIAVGAGGAAQTAQKTSGNAGSPSSITGTGIEPIEAEGGAGGQGGDGNYAAAGDPIPGKTSVIVGGTYGEGGAMATSSAYGQSGQENTGNGGVGGTGEKNSVSGAGGSGIVYVNVVTLKDQHDCGMRTTAVGEDAITIPYDEAWGDDWILRAADGTIVSAERSGDDIVVKGLKPGRTTVRVVTADDMYNYTLYVAAEPHDVDFCEGDSVKIWYHNPEPKNWFLLINDVRYELSQLGTGEHMNVTLSPVVNVGVDGKTTDTAIVADAVTVGVTTNGDLVVISDGVNYYAYRMSCAPLREIPIGESTNMTCSTVAVNTWKAAATAHGEDYRDFIDVSWTNADTPSHSTEVTMTGLELTDEAYVQAWDNEYDSAEENAQGAVYTLKVAVVGAPTINVNLSSGVTMPVLFGKRHATDATSYEVRTVDGSYEGITATLVRNKGETFELMLSTEKAAPGMTDLNKTATFQVYADGELVVTYAVVVSFQFSMVVGQTAPGYMPGVKKTPWVTTSSDPSIVSVRPVLYNQLHSAEAKALKEGEATFYSTNAYWKAGYFGIRAKVADEHTTNLSLMQGATTNIVVTHAGNYAGEWTKNNDDRVQVTLDSTEPSKTVGVTITAGETPGPVVFEVQNGYHIEHVNVFIDDENTVGKTKVLVPGRFVVAEGGSLTLPVDCVKTDWTATSANEDIATVGESGTVGAQVVVNGEHGAGFSPEGNPLNETLVTVVGADSVYVYKVGVVLPSDVNRDVGTLIVGQMVEMPTTKLEGTVTAVSAADPMVVQCALNGDKVSVTGLQEGMTTIMVTTSEKIYYFTVTVRTNHIDKKIELVVGENSKSTYSYTFDSNILWISNNAPKLVSAEVNGPTVTFTPIGLPCDYEEAQVLVGGFVDGLQHETTLHYWIAVKQAGSGEEVWTKEGGTGYVTYGGAAQVIDNGDELVLVYANVNDLGSFSVPAPYTAKVDILAVGGGGGGGSTVSFGSGGGGGGAGGFTEVDDKRLAGGTYAVKVGAGGSAGSVEKFGVATQGSNGGDSFITNQVGYAYASAKGGGGGAAPLNRNAADGVRGGSGGGAVWATGASESGTGGACVGGQGSNGGSPEKSGWGGGGGGAGGVGGATCEIGAACAGGAGATNAITGTVVLYAQGGQGGRPDTQKIADEVDGPGFGGNGGNGGPGSDGADGVVIVRVTDIYRNIKVPIPTTNDILRTGFIWQEGETYSGLVYDDKSEFRSSTDAHPHLWVDAIESVTGITSTNCTLSATEIDPEDGGLLKLGVGYHNFSIRLKDGYAWEDNGGPDSYGETGTLSFRWTVSKEGTVKVAAIDVTKAVTWNDTSNATVTITTYSTPEASAKRRDGVLVLGSLCTSHGFDSNVWVAAAQALADVSDTDYYYWFANPTVGGGKGNSLIYGNLKPLTEVNEEYNGKCAFYGHLDKGDTYEYTQGLVAYLKEIGGMHGTYLYFVDMLYHVMQAEKNGGKKYGYIVFSFDGTQLADSDYASLQTAADQLNITLQNSQHPHAAEVAEWLAENFYKDGSVIWLTTDGVSTSTDKDRQPSSSYTDPKGTILTPILDPYSYLNSLAGKATRQNASAATKAELYPDQAYWTFSATANGKTTTAENVYTNQIYYGNADEVAQFLRSRIKVKPYNMELTDKIVSPDKGLTIQSMIVQACTNGTDRAASTNEADWVDLIGWDRATGETTFPLDPNGETWGIPGASLTVDIVSNNTVTVISNVDFDVWTRIKINVLDDGKFRRSADAVFNEMTGQWEKNPNEGKAFAELVGNDGISMKVDGDAETQVPWTFEANPVTAIVHYGEAFVDGQDLDEVWVGEGLNCSVYYRGYGGYTIEKIIVDDTTEFTGDALAEFAYSYTFEDIRTPRKIEIFYKPFFGTVSSAPVTNVYDGAAHPYDVKLDGWDESVSNEVRYALWDDRDNIDKYMTAEEFRAFCASTNNPAWDPNEVTDVGAHKIAYRIFALQPGYGKTWTDKGWVWVEESTWQAVGEKCGEDYSVITPAPLVVKPEYHPTIDVGQPLPDLGIIIDGLVGAETLGNVTGEGATNGWSVGSTYEMGFPEGIYPTWVEGANGKELVSGDPTLIDPTIGDDGNWGNYYLLPEQSFQAVVRIPIDIGGVPQGPGLDPELPGMNTGVDRVEKTYDGVSTGLVVDVTSKWPDGTAKKGQPLVEGEDYTIEWAIGDLSDPSTPPADGITLEDQPPFLHVGTNVVWYYVHTKEGSDANGLYFAASNYSYVIIHPRPLVIESPSDEKVYNGEPLIRDATKIVEGSLVNGDTLTTNTFAEIVNVGMVTNTFKYAIETGDPNAQPGVDYSGDYDVTVRYGKLTVTPAHFEIGNVPYDNPNNPPSYGKDPETGKSKTGVEDAIKVYDGIPTNIIVDVTYPGNPDDYEIYYSYTTNGTDWTERTTENPVFTNVVDATVKFEVVPKKGTPAEGNYTPAENFARVLITPAPLYVKPADVAPIGPGMALPDIPITYRGLVDGDTLADVFTEDDTNGWHVVSTYDPTKGEGTYPTWVETEDGTRVGEDTELDDPTLSEWRFGNYYLVNDPNDLDVGKKPIDIGDVPQVPGLTPTKPGEEPGMDTGVDPVIKVYDGDPTNVVVEVTSNKPGTNEPLVPGEDYEITWGIGDPEHPDTPPAEGFKNEEPEFVHAGTNVVWYVVEPKPGSDAEKTYLPATNYAYVVVLPRPITIESESGTWKYDGKEHGTNGVNVVEGSLVNGDTLTTNNFNSVTGVGTNDNTFAYAIVSGDPDFKGNPADDYIVTVREGELVVTPAGITIGDVTYPDDPTVEPPKPGDKDPETGKSKTGVEDVIKVYDGIPTNIVVDVTLPDGVEYEIKYRYTTDDGETWTEWSDELPVFTNVVNATVEFEVKATGDNANNYTPAHNTANVVITKRPVTVTADSAEKSYDGTPLKSDGFTVEPPTETTGFVDGEGLESVTMTDDSTITDPGAQANVVDPTKTVGNEKTDLNNYDITYEEGTLTVKSVIAYSNIHGLLKIETAYTNTIIPAPWSDYSRDGSPTNDIRVDRMVKPRNLTDGDLLLQWANGGVYKAWILEKDKGEEGMWTPMGMARQQNSLVGGATNVIESFDAIYVKPDGSETQKRGYGLWLMRQNPLDERGKPRPFYLYGQWLTGEETVTIGGTDADDVAVHYPGAHYGVVHDTMLANPDCTRGTAINGYSWTGADGADTIIINNDTSMHTYCSRLQKSKRQGGGWYDGWWQYGLSGYTQDGIATPVGVGFWYERRAAGPMTHTWTADAPKYAGDGEDHDVWIVDHADAGDGKTHLAFKLGGRLAPETVTRDFIKQLFDSKSIRYLHATGATQAEGKAMLDSLTAALPEGARPVPALRNDTGVNTEEELAKGWIWVTVDATDGTNEKSEADGTGDTNGAGDLWRIVVGRGVWSER